MKLTFQALTAVLGLASLAIVGCTGPSEDMTETTEDNVAVFTCPGGETIEAVFPAEMGEDVTVTLPGQEAMTLPQVEAASGAKYSDGSTTFWEKGGEALVEVDGEIVLEGCTTE